MTLELSKLSGQVQAMGQEMAVRDREYAEQVTRAQGWLTEYAQQAQQLGEIIRESSFNAAIPTDEPVEDLERIMRCGCGLCGLCVLDPLGLLVCNDGPIFNGEDLKKIKDFGRQKRDFSGKKISLDS